MDISKQVKALADYFEWEKQSEQSFEIYDALQKAYAAGQADMKAKALDKVEIVSGNFGDGDAIAACNSIAKEIEKL